MLKNSNPNALIKRDIFEYLDLCTFICSSKLAETSTMKDTTTLFVYTESFSLVWALHHTHLYGITAPTLSTYGTSSHQDM